MVQSLRAVEAVRRLPGAMRVVRGVRRVARVLPVPAYRVAVVGGRTMGAAAVVAARPQVKGLGAAVAVVVALRAAVAVALAAAAGAAPSPCHWQAGPAVVLRAAMWSKGVREGVEAKAMVASVAVAVAVAPESWAAGLPCLIMAR